MTLPDVVRAALVAGKPFRRKGTRAYICLNREYGALLDDRACYIPDSERKPPSFTESNAVDFSIEDVLADDWELIDPPGVTLTP